MVYLRKLPGPSGCVCIPFILLFFKVIMTISLKLQGKTDPNAGNDKFDDEESEEI